LGAFGPVGAASPTLHLLLGCVFASALATLEPAAKSLSSLLVPQRLQGRAFGALDTIAALGRILGSSAGAWLYALRPAAPGAQGASEKTRGELGGGLAEMFPGGSMPFALLAAGLVGAACALVAAAPTIRTRTRAF
jgi:hypothetical protein